MFSDRSAIASEPDALERALAARRERGEPVVDVSGAPRIDASGGTVPSSAPRLAPLLLLCDPGDEVLVPEPSGGGFAHAAQLAGVSLAPYPLSFDGRWNLDAQALWEAIGERTRAIVAIRPNDATGASLSDAELEAIDSLELPVILDGADAGGAPSTALRLTLGVDRIAVSGPGELVEEAVARLAAIERALGREIVDPAVVARGDGALRAALEGSGIELPADPGRHAALRVPGEDDEAWALALLERGVRVTPGSRLGFPDGQAWLAIDRAADPDDLRRAAAALVELSSRGGPGSR